MEHSYARESPSVSTKAVQNLTLSSISAESNREKVEECRLDVEKIILKELNSQMDGLCTTYTAQGSVLGDLALPASKLTSAAFDELRKRVPFLFKVLTVASFSVTRSDSAGESTIALIYAMLMRSRNKRFTAYPRIMTAVCLRYHASNQVNKNAT